LATFHLHPIADRRREASAADLLKQRAEVVPSITAGHSAHYTADAGGGDREGAGRLMIPVPSQVRIWLAVGRTDMRRGMQGLALQVQETLGRDAHAGDLYVFRGAAAI
jgi:hypothetical protein